MRRESISWGSMGCLRSDHFKFGFIEEIHAEQARQIQDTKIQDILLSQGFFISCILYLCILYLFAKQQFARLRKYLLDKPAVSCYTTRDERDTMRDGHYTA